MLKLRCCTAFGSAHLSTVARACRALRKLTLSRCEAVGDDGLVAVAAHCPMLEKLDVSWADGVTDVGIVAALSMPRLAILAAQGCKAITAVVAQAIVDAPSLRLADLSWVNAFSTELVEDVLRAHPKLAVVDYYGVLCKGAASEARMARRGGAVQSPQQQQQQRGEPETSDDGARGVWAKRRGNNFDTG